jgi:hypothetical protein
MTDSTLDGVFARLARSPFRARFKLTGRDRKYLEDRGLEAVLGHGQEFIVQKLAPAHPVNDGKQTPMRGHPVFVAQHATATCCRGCLEKWHAIPRGKVLSQAERRYVLSVINRWLEAQGVSGTPRQGRLF